MRRPSRARSSPARRSRELACANCHSREAAQQASTAHAAALSRAGDHALSGSFPLGPGLNRPPGYQFDFRRSEAQFKVRIEDRTDTMDVPLEWAFGAGRQAVTFVTRVNKDWYLENYWSYFTASKSWGPTPGQESLQAATLPLAAGVLYKTTDPNTGVLGCFECHSTGPVSFNDSGEVKLGELGVHCESCHGPGAEHAAAPSRKKISSPARLSAAELNQFCGKCHRPPASNAAAIDWNNAWNVRHQPLYLNESACFRKSKGALSCLTCHDPHDRADKKSASSYNTRCTECHGISKEAPRPSPVCLKQSPANCVDCHMPRVSPQTSLRFTNHWIGVYGDGAKLKPIR